MSLKATNLVVNKVADKKPASSRTQDSSSNSKQPLSMDATQGSAIVVDGKVKPISKKSAYLLDMLSLDE